MNRREFIGCAAATLAAGLAAADCVIPVGAGGSIQKALDEAGAVRAADRAETLNWFLENEYGVRPAATENPDVSFVHDAPDRELPDGSAVRKRIRVTYRGPSGAKWIARSCRVIDADRTDGPIAVPNEIAANQVLLIKFERINEADKR